MKICPKCNASIIDTAKFCSKCGVNIKKYEEEKANNRFCPECGTEMADGDFCTECGFQVNAAANEEMKSAEPTLGDCAIDEEAPKPAADFGGQPKASLDAFEYVGHPDGTYTVTGVKDKSTIIYSVPQGVVSIAENAFAGSDAIKIILPNGILQIGNGAFKACKNLVSINLPESLLIVGDEVFADCELLEVKLPESVIKAGKDVLKNTLPDKKKQEETAKANKAEEERKTELKKWEIGGTPTFGSYWKKGEKEPIQWVVLTREADNVLLISKEILEAKKYHTPGGDITWEGCTIRKWLNEEFIQQAFNEKERQKIQLTNINNPGGSYYNSSTYQWMYTKGGSDTRDKAFLLSKEEAKIYFGSDVLRRCTPTVYAKSHGAATDGNGYAGWLLRTPGAYQSLAVNIQASGAIYDYGTGGSNIFGVRPAIWVKLES